MTLRIATLAGLLCLTAGCSSGPATKPEAVAVSGTVLLPAGQPAKGVTLNFFPTTSSQTQVYAQLKADGKFDVKLVPGKYTYGFEGGPAFLKVLPTKYHSNDAAHTVEIPSAGKSDLTIQLAD